MGEERAEGDEEKLMRPKMGPKDVDRRVRRREDGSKRKGAKTRSELVAENDALRRRVKELEGAEK